MFVLTYNDLFEKFFEYKSDLFEGKKKHKSDLS